MATETLQVGRAIKVLPSDNAQIPFPNARVTGTNTSTSSGKLINSSATFLTSKVEIGDIVYNTTDGTAATVTDIDSETSLSLNANIFSATSKAYKVYPGEVNRGCLLYTGVAGDVAIITSGGDSVTIVGALAGEYHPVHVLKVLSTGTSATDILAFW